MVAGREEAPLTLNRGGRQGQSDGYVVSRLTGRLAVTALGNPSRDLGFFPFAQNAAAVILADAAGGESTRHGARFALEFLAPLEDPSAAHSVTIRWTQLESWLSTIEASAATKR